MFWAPDSSFSFCAKKRSGCEIFPPTYLLVCVSSSPTWICGARLSRRFGEAKRNASETQSKSIVLRSACANGARLETAAEKVDEVKKVHLFCFFLVYELVSSSSSGPQRRRRRREGWRRRRRRRLSWRGWSRGLCWRSAPCVSVCPF